MSSTRYTLSDVRKDIQSIHKRLNEIERMQSCKMVPIHKGMVYNELRPSDIEVVHRQLTLVLEEQERHRREIEDLNRRITLNMQRILKMDEICLTFDMVMQKFIDQSSASD